MSLLTQELSDLAGQWIVRPSYPLLIAPINHLQLVGYNPLRWALQFAFPQGATGTFFPDAGLAQSQGFISSAQNILWSWNYRDHGGLVQAAWFYTDPAAFGNVTVSVIEVLLQQ